MIGRRLKTYAYNTARLARKHVRLVVAACFICILTLHLPKPTWLCCSVKGNPYRDVNERRDLSFYELSKLFADIDRKGTTIPETYNEKQAGSDDNIIRMFPLYAKSKKMDREPYVKPIENDTTAKLSSMVKVFHLQNLDFRDFSRYWLNEVPTKLQSTRQQQDDSQNIHPQFINQRASEILSQIRGGRQGLPDCVSLRLLRQVQPPTKVCLHFLKDDNFISSRLRDTGQWEAELVDQMQTFFETTPNSQLVDLGCNLGVYSLVAARLRRPVLAVEILPANLALVQLSILRNDALTWNNWMIGTGTDEPENLVHSNLIKEKERTAKSDQSIGDESDDVGQFLQLIAKQKDGDENILKRKSTKKERNIDNASAKRSRPHFRTLLSSRAIPQPVVKNLGRSISQISDINNNANNKSAVNTAGRPPQPLFSELITTLHNAVYSKRTTMFVDLKDDLNLGGMEVREMPEPALAAYPSLLVSERQQVTANGRNHMKDETFSGTADMNDLLKDRLKVTADVLTLASEMNDDNRSGADKILLDRRRNHQFVDNINKKDETDTKHNIESRGKDSHSRTLTDNQSPYANEPRIQVAAVCLDDLVPYTRRGLSVFLKMDIEGAEEHALRCADGFFSNLDVRVVQMEILFLRYSGRMGQVSDFFRKYGLFPAQDARGKGMLGSDTATWPDNIYWVKVR